MTLAITESGREVWRKYVVDGNPASGLHHPDLNEAQQWAGEVESIIDAVFGVSVVTRALSTPPGSPAVGARYIVGALPSGDWSTFAEDDVVEWDGAAWSNRTPQIGNSVYVVDENTSRIFTVDGWIVDTPQTAAKVEAYFGTIGNIVGSFGVTSITDVGPGIADVNFSTPFAAVDYASLVTCESSSVFVCGQVGTGANKVVGHCRVFCTVFSSGAAATADPNAYNFVAYGNQ